MLKIKEKKVRELIGNTGLSVRAWSADHGFAQPTLSSWLNGTRNIKKSQLIKLAKALHVDDLSEISFVEFHLDQEKIDHIENELAEVRNFWKFLSSEQRISILNLIRTMADSHMNGIQKDE